MKQMRCDSCGAKLKIDEKTKYAYCEYCGSKVKVNDEQMEQFKTYNKIVKFVAIGIFATSAIIFILIICQIFFMGNFIKDSGFFKDDVEVHELDESKEVIDEIDIVMFNSYYEARNGTQDLFIVKKMLEQVVLNNTKNKDKIIVISYKDKDYSDPDELRNFKNNLQEITYEVVLNYNDQGFINKISLL